MKHLKIFSLIFSFAIMSCQENKPKENSLKDEIPEGITGHTFFKVDQTKNGKVLYKPCDANIPKYKIFKDSIFHNWGQEYYSYNITSVKNMRLQTSFRTSYKYNKETPDTKDSLVIFEKTGKDRTYWKINGEIFIDSLYVNKIPNITQLCSECYDDCGSTISNNVNNNISQKWYGDYYLNNFEDKKNWEKSYDILISITKDFIIYEATGYQLFEKYLLKSDKNIVDTIMKLSFDKLLDGSESALLEKTKKFGIITFNGKSYVWESPYIDFNFNNGKKVKYILTKRK